MVTNAMELNIGNSVHRLHADHLTMATFGTRAGHTRGAIFDDLSEKSQVRPMCTRSHKRALGGGIHGLNVTAASCQITCV